MQPIEILASAAGILLYAGVLLHTLLTLAYARSDRPIIEERLRRYASATEN